MRATVEQATLLEGMRIRKQSDLLFARHYASQHSSEVQRSSAEAAGAQAALRGLGKKRGSPLLEWERLPSLEVEYARLKRELDDNAAAYELVVRQVEQLRILETRPVGRAEVIEPPTTPEARTRPSGMILVLSGALLGMLAGGLPLLRAHVRIGLSRLGGLLTAVDVRGSPRWHQVQRRMF
jgi:uncharacterized protein involved in exopolysaccharide biosynthesis